MAAIKGKSGQQLEVDGISYAARVTLYDKLGNPIVSEPKGSYMLPVSMGRQTAAIASGSSIWTMRNNTVKTMRLQDIMLMAGFDGTPAATSAIYNLVRFSAATPSGGAAVLPIKTKSGWGVSNLLDARQDPAAALTVTNVVFETAFATLNCPRQNGATNDLQLMIGKSYWDAIELAPSEGLAIQLGAVGVIGDVISGYVRWIEV